jgi:flagellar L-ring protein precursor FlgH
MFLVLAQLAFATPPQPPVVPDAASEPETPSASLWDPNDNRYVGLTSTKHRVGDLVTVEIDESQVASVNASTRSNRESSSSGGVRAMFGLVDRLVSVTPTLGGDDGSIGYSGDQGASFDGGGDTQRGSVLVATLTCEVIEVLDNGNLHIWGYKTLVLNDEAQYLIVDAIIRPADIQMDNTLPSDRLAQGTVQMSGDGAIADRQSPGFLARGLDKAWPF